MTNEEKILQALEQQGKTITAINDRLDQQGKALENLQAGQQRMENDVKDLKQEQIRLEQGQAQQKTLLKVLEAGQNDIRENMATKADVQDVKAEQGKLKRRIENVEESTKTPNPHKN